MKKLLSLTLVLALLFNFTPVANYTSVKADTAITSFTVSSSGNIPTPVSGESIWYPDTISVASTVPAGLQGHVNVDYMWYDNEHNEAYYESSGDTGKFSPGEWDLTVYFEPEDGYILDTTKFEIGGPLEHMTIGGYEMEVDTVCEYYVGYGVTLDIADPGSIPEIKTTEFEDTYVGIEYSQQIELILGTEPVAFSIASGKLPDGLSMDSTGKITGTATTAGTYNFKVKAENTYGYATRNLSITVLSNDYIIQSFTLDTTKPFDVPKAGDKITYPNNVYVKTTNPASAKQFLSIDYMWYDHKTGKSYYSNVGDTGTFTEGEWDFQVFVNVTNYDYWINYELFEKTPSLNIIYLGGYYFGTASLGSTVVGYNYRFDIKAEAQTTTKKGSGGADKTQPAATKIKKIKSAKKSLKVSWNKIKGISGYQLQCSLKKNFKKIAKQVNIKKWKTTSCKIKKLKKKKAYYVRIRTYKLDGKKKVYSDWSKAVKKKTK